MQRCRVAALTAFVVIARVALGISLLTSAALAAGFDGSGYVQIAPTFNGSDGNQSYVRLSNDGTAATTFTVKVVGSPSGNVYGTGTIQVAPAAAPQYALSQLVSTAQAGPLANGDTSYSVYLQNTAATAFYQHVIYNGANGFFENMSTCKYASSGNYTGLNSRLDNVHTSQLSGYPATIAVHNYASTSVTYNAGIYDAATGALIGTVPVAVAANATNAQPFSWYEQQLHWTPGSGQLHVNIVFQASGSASYAAEVSDYIYNSALSAYVNMTQRCPTAATATVAAASCPSANFLTVTANSHNSAYAAPSLTVSCSLTQATVTSNGIPNFEFVQSSPNALKVANATYHLALTPTVATTNTSVPLVGAVAVSVGGLAIYGPTESPADGSKDPKLNVPLDTCGGHTDQLGAYHHHYRPDCLFADATKVGQVIGYAFDGYPILEPYECTDTSCSTVYKVHSSYAFIGGSTAAWDSNKYVAGKGNLDKCNGMTRPDGTYAYYATDEFPYFAACYHGVVDTSNFIQGANTLLATIK